MAFEGDSYKSRQQRDFDDLNKEVTGRNAGRIDRFTGEKSDLSASRRKDRSGDEDTLMSLAEMARRSAAYQERLRTVERRLEALDRASLEALHAAEQRLETLRDNANRTVDGRLVFRSAEDGRLYDEEGTLVSPEHVDPEAWDPNAPTREQYEETLDRIERIRDWREQRQAIEERASDNPTEDELDALERELEDLESDMPASIRRYDGARHGPDGASTEAQRSTSAARGFTGPAGFDGAASVRPLFARAAAGETTTPPAATPRPEPADNLTM